MGGIAATRDFLLVPDRDALDTQDIFRCLRTSDGQEVWAHRILVGGHLDYGSSPRATPQIHGDWAYFYNAFGMLHCVHLSDGELVWEKNLLQQYGGRDQSNAWGTASSPLVVDGKLIVNPGGQDAAVVALKPESGDLIWKTKGDYAAFASFIVGTFGGRRQLVGYEKRAVVGLEIETGEQLWSIVPPRANDFNVPTPINVGGRLLLSTENNGTRIYDFDDKGIIRPEPTASNMDLAPDTHSPIVLGDRVFGVWLGIVCLDLNDGLKTIYLHEDPAFDDYAVLVGSGERVLAISKYGELILLAARDNEFKPISRVEVFENDPGVFSHPAFIGTRMYLRSSSEVVCLELDR